MRFLLSGILVVCLATLYGCVNVESFKSRLIPSKPEESYIQATRKSELVFEDVTRIVLIAVHLNAFDEQHYPHEKGEVFLWMCIKVTKIL